jgi:hypothetical protein
MSSTRKTENARHHWENAIFRAFTRMAQSRAAVLTSEVLYQLSYVGESAVDGIGRTAASRVRPPST